MKVFGFGRKKIDCGRKQFFGFGRKSNWFWSAKTWLWSKNVCVLVEKIGFGHFFFGFGGFGFWLTKKWFGSEKNIAFGRLFGWKELSSSINIFRLVEICVFNFHVVAARLEFNLDLLA